MARQIAHEIKNPLTPMKLSIQHLQRAIKNDPERVPELAERVSKTMVEQIDNLSEIATAFSSFAKMPKANKDQVNLLQLIQNIVALFNQNEDHPVKLTTELTEAWVFADKNQLVSVLNNLVKNAQQATEDISNGQIEISIAEKNENYILAVKDNGIGIAQSMRNKVFVPNFTTKSSGMGLGLAISKQIVENSQGKIWFESEENKGSTFFVTFPKSRRDS
jgi:nitrogen fixation/metabolism regulation signal transduction histidine kinase